jgi:ADP-ribose pyrophosphatase YjhB (NUDIX family)
MELTQRLRMWADELHSIADEGITYRGDDAYTRHRMDRVLRIAAELYGLQDVRDAVEIERLYREPPAHLTPYVAGEGAVFNGAGEVLLVQRADDGLWALPGGAFEVGETAAEGACREVHEETGVAVEPISLVGVYDSRRCSSRASTHLYHLVFLCRRLDASAQPGPSNETLDAGWFAESSLPPLSPCHALRIPDAFRHHHGTLRHAVFH